MAKPNYSFEKRQRELAKKKKKEEKEKGKAERKAGHGGDSGSVAGPASDAEGAPANQSAEGSPAR